MLCLSDGYIGLIVCAAPIFYSLISISMGFATGVINVPVGGFFMGEKISKTKQPYVYWGVIFLHFMMIFFFGLGACHYIEVMNR